MRYEKDTREGSSATSKLTYLLIGGAIGAALALLFAPKSGQDLREDIADVFAPRLGQVFREDVADVTRKGLERVRETAEAAGMEGDHTTKFPVKPKESSEG
jgi:gas vesicle protein